MEVTLIIYGVSSLLFVLVVAHEAVAASVTQLSVSFLVDLVKDQVSAIHCHPARHQSLIIELHDRGGKSESLRA